MRAQSTFCATRSRATRRIRTRALASRWVHHRIDGRWLRGFVLVFAIVSGVVLIVR